MSHSAKRREILSHQRFQLWVKSLYASLYTTFFTVRISFTFSALFRQSLIIPPGFLTRYCLWSWRVSIVA